MPKLTIDRVSQVIARVMANDFKALGAGDIYQRANRFYQKALGGQLVGQERLDAYEFYKLSLQMDRSTDPRARLALLGFELEIPGNGWIQARKFETAMATRNDFEKRIDDKDPNSELVARGQDWTITIPVTADKFLEVMLKAAVVSRDFPGVTLAIPETAADQKTIVLYANHDLVRPLAAKLTDKGIDHTAYRPCYDKDGNVIWQLELIAGRMGFDQSPYQRTGGSSAGLINNDRGMVSDPAHNFAAITDVGTLQYREKNEDSAGHVAISEGVEAWVVEDGMGGHARGDVASKVGVETMLTALKSGKTLIEAVLEANQAVIKVNQEAVARGEQGGAGTTMVALLIDRKAKIGQIAWVGDSRARFVDENAEGLLTIDHSFQYSVIKGEMQAEGKSMELPLTLDKLADIDNRIENAGDMVRSHGNVISSVLGHQGNPPPTIGLVEFALGDGAKPAKIALYSDGAIDGPANKTAAEKAIIEIVRQGHSPDLIVDELLAQAYSAGTADNVTVALVNVPEGLSLAELKEISGEKFQQALIARLSDVNYQMTMGDLKYMVEVYLLNPSIIPPELIERTKQKVLVSKNADATELMRKIDPSIPPVQPAAPPPPPLPAPGSNPGATVPPPPAAPKIVTAAAPNGAKDNWVVNVKFDPSNGELSQAAAQIIGRAFRPHAKTKFFTVVLSSNFSVLALNDQKTLELFLQLLEKNITQRKWHRKKDRFYVLYSRQEPSGEPRFDVYREGELEAAYIKQHFPE